MDNEVVIHVRTKNEGKAGFEAIAKDADTQARTIGTSFAEKLSNHIKNTVTTRLASVLGQAGGAGDVAGRSLGDRIGITASQRITERLTRDVNGRLRDSLGRFVSGGDGGNGGDARGGRGGEGGRGGDSRIRVDVDKQSFLSKMFGLGKEGAGKFGDGFKGALGSVFGGDVLSMIVKVIAGGLLAAGIAPAIGAGITSAILLALGGGAIAIGVAGAFKDPRIRAAAKAMATETGKLMERFSSNFKGPVEDFFAPANGGNGGLIGVLRQITPMVEHLGQVLGPVAANIGAGIIGFLQNALPGVLRAIEKSAPVLNMLADKLPGLGDDMAKFFDHIGNGAPGAAAFLGDFLEGLGRIIRVLGKLIEWLSTLYLGAHRTFFGIIAFVGDVVDSVSSLWRAVKGAFDKMIGYAGNFLTAAATAFGWIPGLGPKLTNAQAQFKKFRDGANGALAGIIKSVTVNVKFNVVGLSAANAAVNTARILAGMGYQHGGITGAATGGLHGGLRMVGEHGPELVQLPPGSRVNSNPDTERMLAGQGGGVGTIIVQLMADGKVLAQTVVEPMRELIRSQGRGSAQTYLGQPGVS